MRVIGGVGGPKKLTILSIVYVYNTYIYIIVYVLNGYRLELVLSLYCLLPPLPPARHSSPRHCKIMSNVACGQCAGDRWGRVHHVSEHDA